jgi:hypothetical protein
MKLFNLLMGSLFFALVSMATVVPPAFCAGSDWVQLDDNEDSRFFFDKAGATRDKGVVRVETRAVYTEAGKADALTTLSKTKELGNLYESRYEYDLNCEKQQSRLLHVAHFDKDGNVLRKSDLSAVTQWEPVPMGTRMTLVLEAACPAP